MKKVLTVVTGMVVYSAMLLSSASTARADSGIWTNEVDGVWSDTAAWLNGIVADGAGKTALFSNAASATVIVTVDSARIIGNLDFAQGTYTITNGGVAGNTLTLAGPPKPVIIVPGGYTATLGGIALAGTDGFVLDGGGQLNIFKATLGTPDPANQLTGDVILSNGILAVVGNDVSAEGDPNANDPALDGITSFTFYNGSTLNIRPDASTSPSYGTVDANLIVPEGQSGVLILPVRFSGSSGDGGGVGTGLGGTLTGSGTLTVRPKYIRGNVVGDWSAFAGQINIAPDSATGGGDEFRFGNAAGFPSAVVNLSGTITYTARYYPGLASNTVIPIGMLIGDNANAYLAGSMTAAYTLFFDIGAKQTDPNEVNSLSANIVNGTGPAGIIWRGAGRWVLTGNNTYTGPTIISNGVVQVGDGWSEAGSLGAGPVTNYAAIELARSGVLWIQGGIHGPGSLTNSGSGTNIISGVSTYSGPTVVASGKLELGTGSTLPGSFTVRDGASFGVRMQSASGNVSIGSLAFGSSCTLDYEFAGFANPVGTVLTDSGNLTMNGDITVNISGTGLQVGSITLLEYASRSGTGTFVLGALPPNVTGANIIDDQLNKRVVLQITSVFDPTLVWVGDAAGVWDIGNPANLVWKVAGSGAAAYYTDGKMVKFDDTATGTTTIDVSTAVAPSLVTVDNTAKDYTFTGSGYITGSGLLIKRGTGRLTISTANNDWSGGSLIEAGTVQLGDGTNVASGLGSGQITNNAILLFRPGTDITVANVISGTGTVIQEGPGILTLSGNNTHTGGLIVRSNATFVNNNGNAVGGAGATLTLDSGIVSLATDIFSGKRVVVLGEGAVLNGSNRRIDSPIVGTNAILRLTNGALLTFTADLHGFNGTIELDSQTGQSLRFNAGGSNPCTGSSNALFYFNPPAGQTNWLISRNGGTMYLGGIAGGPGRIDQGGTAVSYILSWVIGWLNVDTTWTGYFTDSARTNALTKVGTGKLTLENVALEHKGAVIVNNGVLAFKGTTVNSPTNMAYVIAEPGVLDLSEADVKTLTLGTGALPQTLAGNGTIRGSVALAANAQLEPGTAIGVLTLADPATLRGTIGVLTVTNAVTLGGVATMEISKTATPNSDRLVASSITYGGSLIVTNIGPDLVGVSNVVFQLFSAPSVSGSFSSVLLPPVPANHTWQNNLAVDGTLVLVSTVNPTPPTLTASVTGPGAVKLTWPADRIGGWVLQVQTNSVSTGISTNWVTVAGSIYTNEWSLGIDPAEGCVFARLLMVP